MIKRILRAATQIVFLALFIFLVLSGRPIFWLAIFGLSIILAVFFGRIYCGWICPINAVMRPVNWLYSRLKLKRFKAPRWLKPGVVPWVMLGLLAAVMVAGRIFRINIPGLLIILGLGFVLSLMFKPEVFHNHICPYGILQSLTGRAARLSFRVNKDSCSGCGICADVCEAKAVNIEAKVAEISPRYCHQCSNCQVECPRNAISYRKA